MQLLRLNKYLKDTGVCSRRGADEFILKGYIQVNGKVVTELGVKINPLVDKVTVLPELNQAIAQFRYILLNKPIGYVCTKSNIDGLNIFSLVPPIDKLTYAGRLDKDSHGLIILSNDGKFVYAVASGEYAKEYIVRVNKPISRNFLIQQGNGSIKLDGRMVKPCQVELIDEFTYRIILVEGINRQIRRMAENQGYRVTDLKRVRIAEITDSNLPPGKWRELSVKEIKLHSNRLDSQ